MSFQLLSLSPLLSLCLIISILTHPSSSAVDSFVYGGCSQQKYAPGTPYETNVNSLLTCLVNSAAFATYNNFKISVPGSGPNDIVYGLFQCRGDVRSSDCRECVARSVSQLGVLCVNTACGALQLEGCFVKYDNVSFLGVQDKSVMTKKCGPSIGYDSEALARRDGVLDELASGGQYFRVVGSGKLQGVTQCVQDLSVSDCQDCLAEATGRLKNECGPSAWGDMFLGKCYARYWERGDYSRDDNRYHDHHDDHDNNDGNETKKTLSITIGTKTTLSIIIGVTAGASLLIVVRSSLNKPDPTSSLQPQSTDDQPPYKFKIKLEEIPVTPSIDDKCSTGVGTHCDGHRDDHCYCDDNCNNYCNDHCDDRACIMM